MAYPSVATDVETTGLAIPSLNLAINPSGNNRVLLVTIQWIASNTISSVTFKGNGMTHIATAQSGNYKCAVYYLIAPSTGSGNVTVTMSNNTTIVVSAIAIQDADQTDPIGASNTETGTSNSGNSISITTEETESLVIDACLLYDPADADPTADGSQTELHDLEGSSANRGVSSWKQVASAGATTMDWSWSYVIPLEYRHIAVEVKKALIDTDDERDAETHGQDTANAERDSELTGTPAPVITDVSQIDAFTIRLTWTYDPDP